MTRSTTCGTIRLVYFAAMIAAIVVVPACNRPSHTKARQGAQQRWNEARAGVKYQLARQQYERGLFDEVVTTVSEGLNLDPTNVDAYVLLARANLELSRPASAERAIQAARMVGLDSPDLQYTQGVILELRGRIDDARKRYGRARSLDPTNVDYLIAQAECLVELDRGPEALALLEENANSFDDDGALALLAGHIAALLGDEEIAAGRYAQALETLSESPCVSEELGLLLARSKRCDESVALLGPLLSAVGEDGPEMGAVRRALAFCHLALGDFQSAQEVLLDYARSHPRDGAAQLMLAKAAIGTADLVTAARAADLAERCLPGNSAVRFLRATVQWRWGDFAAARRTLEELLAANPHDAEAHCLLGEVLASQRHIEESANAFYRALQIDPTNSWAAGGLREMEIVEASEAAHDASTYLAAPPRHTRR